MKRVLATRNPRGFYVFDGRTYNPKGDYWTGVVNDCVPGVLHQWRRPEPIKIKFKRGEINYEKHYA